MLKKSDLSLLKDKSSKEFCFYSYAHFHKFMFKQICIPVLMSLVDDNICT